MSGRRGFTLIEVVVAMAIIAIALMPATQMWVASAKATAATDQLSMATNLAQRTIESKIRDISYANQVPSSGTDAQTGLVYSLTLTPETLAGATTHTLRRAQVTVTRPGDATPLVLLATLTSQEATP